MTKTSTQQPHSDLQGDDDLSVEDGDGGDLGNWNFLHNFLVSVQIDSVDQDLLDQAREEVPIGLNRIWRKIFGRRRQAAKKPNTITPSQFRQSFGAYEMIYKPKLDGRSFF